MTCRKLFGRTLMLALLSACSGGQSDTSAQPPATPPSPQAAASPIIAWLDCVECSESELNALRALGDSVVPELRLVLLNGPTPERLDRHVQHLKRTYDTMRQYEARRKDRALRISEQDYLQRYQQKYILLNRSRAARALGAISGAQARNALSEALKTTLPPELQGEVERALKVVPEGSKPAVTNPDLANPELTKPEVAKPPPPKPPANLKVPPV